MFFFTSDTHWRHFRILELSNRPFKDIDEHDNELVRRWNSVVTENDVVIHLGDVALGPWPVGLQNLHRCNGYKIHIPGNHDRNSSLEKSTRRERFTPDYEEVFDEIWAEQVPFELSSGFYVILSHYPPAQIADHGDVDRYPHMRPVDNGTHIIHGHTHQGHVVTTLASGAKAIHVGVDSWDYTPVSEDKIMALL